MKILIIRTFSGYIDLSNATYNYQELGLARAFNKKGHKCDVVYFGGKESKEVKISYEDNKEYSVYYIKGKEILQNGIYSKELYKLIENYDIVHAGGYDQLESWILAKRIPQKLVIYNGPYYSNFNKGYNKKCKVFDMFFLPRYKKNNIYFDTKSKLSATFLREKGLKNVTPIGVGIDLEQLQAQKMIESEVSKRIKEEKKNGNKIITYIGKLEPRRNTTFLIDLFKSITDKRKNIKLLIIGRGEEDYKKICFDKIKEYGLEDKVIYVEKLQQELLPKIYYSSDVFLLPTRYEIFGMVLLEAMYFGVPVITTYNGGSDMLIEDGKSGKIIDDFDIKKWEKTVEILLDNNDLREKMIKYAKEKIEQEFTWDALTDKFLEVFQNRLNNQ